MVVNLMTCEGFTGNFLACGMAWLQIAIVFFVVMILRRQCDDGVLSGTGFNWIAAMVAGIGIDLLLVTIFGNAAIGLIAGLIGVAVGGFGLGFFGGGSE